VNVIVWRWRWPLQAEAVERARPTMTSKPAGVIEQTVCKATTLLQTPSRIGNREGEDLHRADWLKAGGNRGVAPEAGPVVNELQPCNQRAMPVIEREETRAKPAWRGSEGHGARVGGEVASLKGLCGSRRLVRVRPRVFVVLSTAEAGDCSGRRARQSSWVASC